jgi:hypothetical protein
MSKIVNSVSYSSAVALGVVLLVCGTESQPTTAREPSRLEALPLVNELGNQAQVAAFPHVTIKDVTAINDAGTNRGYGRSLIAWVPKPMDDLSNPLTLIGVQVNNTTRSELKLWFSDKEVPDSWPVAENTLATIPAGQSRLVVVKVKTSPTGGGVVATYTTPPETASRAVADLEFERF